MTFHTNHPGQRHDPGVFLQIAFSVPQQLWNYSSWRKPLSSPRWSTRTAAAIPIWNRSEKVISWSQSRAKLKTSFFFFGDWRLYKIAVYFIYIAWQHVGWPDSYTIVSRVFFFIHHHLHVYLILNLLLAQRSIRKKKGRGRTLFTSGHNWTLSKQIC